MAKKKAKLKSKKVLYAQAGRKAVAKLVGKYGNLHAERIKSSVELTVEFWRPEDGSPEEFVRFCEEHFTMDEGELDALVVKCAESFEQVFGVSLELYRILQRPMNLDLAPVTKLDRMFARIDPFTHAQEMLFESKIAFVVLLNMPACSTEEMLQREDKFTRKEWTRMRLGEAVRHRPPAGLERKVQNATVSAEEYISDYNIYTQILVDIKGEPLYGEEKKLLSHWGIRDEIRAQYSVSEGLARQRALYAVMRRIISQDIPEDVINATDLRWDPVGNRVFRGDSDEAIKISSEPNNRYKHLRQIFTAERAADPYYERDFLDRSFSDGYEIMEGNVEIFLEEILDSPLVHDVADVIRKKLGRKLEPFDIWYNKFVDSDDQKLDAITLERYPSAAAFQADIPNILRQLGFEPAKAYFIASKIQVEACRGSGHAWGTLRRDDQVLLRTRVTAKGLDAEGYRIGMHELGHCVEMVMSMHYNPDRALVGLPNIGFSEGFAFLMEGRALDILGVERNQESDAHYGMLDEFWGSREIAGVALLDLNIWRWMYKHQDASPESINRAMRQIAKAIWNKYFYPILGMGNDDDDLLAIYSHIIGYSLYVPYYAVGSVVQFQIIDDCRGKHWPTEMERLCNIGALSPNAWMKAAVGTPLSLEPMFRLTDEALKFINKK